MPLCLMKPSALAVSVQVGGRNKLAKLLCVAGPYIGRVLNGEKPMTERLAAKLAQTRDKAAVPAVSVRKP